METDKTIIAFLGTTILTQFVFFFLKITNVIDWNWGWILAPLWIPYSILIGGGLLVALYILLCNVKERIFNKHE